MRMHQENAVSHLQVVELMRLQVVELIRLQVVELIVLHLSQNTIKTL
jgi:hypothetical protein